MTGFNWRYFSAALAALSLWISPAVTAQEIKPDIVTGASKLDPIKAGLTHIYFKNWAGPEIPVWIYVPHNIDPKTAPIMFMMHGAKRGAARYLSEWDQVADEHGFIVIAPEFNRKDFPGSRSYNLGNMTAKGNKAPIPEPQWSFSAIEPIFDEVRARLSSNQTRYTLHGHSAGSQFVHRFLFFKPGARVKRYMAANAGWYTFPDLDTPFPHGLGGAGFTKDDLKGALEKDVVVILGDADNDAKHESLNRSKGSMAQGPHRYARGLAFFEKAKANAKTLGVKFGWQLHVVPGVAHSNGGIAEAAGDLVE